MPTSLTRSDLNYLQAPHPRSELHLEGKGRESQLRSLFLKSVLYNLPQRYLEAFFQLWIELKKQNKRRNEKARGQSSSICFTSAQPWGQANLLHLTRRIVRHGLILNSAFARHSALFMELRGSTSGGEIFGGRRRWIGTSHQPEWAVKMWSAWLISG